jgi:hypothetical protein
LKTKNQLRILTIFGLCFGSQWSFSQMITGIWHGKINRQKAEIKIIQQGDSLTGTSYYYSAPDHYRRYSIKGYFDPATNSAVWWDDQLIDEKAGRFSVNSPGKLPLLSRADFNCPGGGVMMLDGKSALKEHNEKPAGDLHLDKTGNTLFTDEWDFVIDNFLVGANDPELIDSIRSLAVSKPIPAGKLIRSAQEINEEPLKHPANDETKKLITPPVVTASQPVRQPTIEEKFTSRKRVFIKDIPLTGDSLELRFYDNAEVDGDSISLFLNNQLIAEHIRLTEKAHVIKLSVHELGETNELTMVAENLGSIPPNTSYMVAVVGDKRYDAYLASSEGSSAMIRFIKPAPASP